MLMISILRMLCRLMSKNPFFVPFEEQHLDNWGNPEQNVNQPEAASEDPDLLSMTLAERVQAISSFGTLITQVTYGDYATYRIGCFLREGNVQPPEGKGRLTWSEEECRNFAKRSLESFYQVSTRFDGFNDRGRALEQMGLSIDEYHQQLKQFEQHLFHLFFQAEAIYQTQDGELLDYGDQHVFFGINSALHLDG